MSEATLNLPWARWQRNRAQSLRTDGLRADLADLISTAEARARQRLVPVIGRRAAETAPLRVAKRGDGLVFALADPNSNWGVNF